jgi:hypothetical protein
MFLLLCALQDGSEYYVMAFSNLLAVRSVSRLGIALSMYNDCGF